LSNILRPTSRQRPQTRLSLKPCAQDLTSPRVCGRRKSLSILWAYHCSPQTTTNKTPFCLTYGTDAIIPVEVGESLRRSLFFQEQQNEENMMVELEAKDKEQEMARIKEEATKL